MKHLRTNRCGVAAEHMRSRRKGSGAHGPTAEQVIDLIRVTISLTYEPLLRCSACSATFVVKGEITEPPNTGNRRQIVGEPPVFR